MSSIIQELRGNRVYRRFEKTLFLSSLVIFLFVVILSLLKPIIGLFFLVIYSLAWLFKIISINIYGLYTFRKFSKWQNLSQESISDVLTADSSNIQYKLEALQSTYPGIYSWKKDITSLQNNTKNLLEPVFSSPSALYQFPIFSLYNESYEVIIHSLKAVFNQNYSHEYVVVFITQEERAGGETIIDLRKKITSQGWVHTMTFVEEAKIVASESLKNTYRNKQLANFVLQKNKLNIVFTSHPDGLEGEIIGKASNEDWAARHVSLFVQAKGINDKQCLLTSLDADSSISKNFFALLAIRYSLTPKDVASGFQPIPVYTKNFFTAPVISRLVAFQTSFWQISQNNLEGKTHFFANYSLPLSVAKEVGFWEKEYIAEDFMLFAKCLNHYGGKFKVYPFYAYFNGDAVIGEDDFEAVQNQYKQLQRWSWGGVEGLPYILHKFFIEKNSIQLTERIKYASDLFLNHHFWSTAPVIFTFGFFIPPLFASIDFKLDPTVQNLYFVSFTFAIISYIFIVIFTFVSIRILILTKFDNQKIIVRKMGLVRIITQSVIQPFVYFFMAIPALDSQIKGFRGKYLGYWVTPKK
jgi:hypothetical protein